VPKKDLFFLKSSQSLFFEIFVRLSKFSYSSSFENISSFGQKQRILSFSFSKKINEEFLCFSKSLKQEE